MSENIARTPREGLDQQLAELGTLRNAGTRSPSFRAWRQATLTLLQRIGGGDPGLSERFRRIPFSPNHNRADMNELRNVYEKGCAEASSVLKEMRDRIGNQPWASVQPGNLAESFEVGSTEDDFPTLDLPPGNGGERPMSTPRHAAKRKQKSKPAAARNTNLGDLLKEAESKDTRESVPHFPLAESRILPPDPDAPASKSKGRRSGPGLKKKDRLKDMLGFVDTPVKPAPVDPPPADAPSAANVPPPVVTGSFMPPVPPPSAMPPVPPAPPAVMPPVPPARPVLHTPGVSPPPPVTSAPPAAIVPPVASPPPPVAPAVPSDLLREMEMSVPPPPPAPIEPEPPVAARPSPPAKTPTLNEWVMTPDFTARLESLDHDAWTSPDVPGPEELEEGLPPEPEAPPTASSAPKRTDVFTAMDAFESPSSIAPPPPVEPPPPVAQQPAAPPASPSAGETPPAAEALDTEGLTEEFLRTSPVLSSFGTPVRKKDLDPRAGQLVPEAIEILEIASRTHELGVPEGRRAHARAYLAELARCLETRNLPWETLRDTIQFLMEFPPLARRVLPLLLPFLDQAA